MKSQKCVLQLLYCLSGSVQRFNHRKITWSAMSSKYGTKLGELESGCCEPERKMFLQGMKLLSILFAYKYP